MKVQLLTFLASCLLSSLFLFFLRPLFKIILLDKPNYRSSHILPIPRGGGISIFLTTLIFSCFNGFWYPLICSPLAIIGFLDDLFNLPKKLRYFIQFLTSIIILAFLKNPEFYFLSNNNYFLFIIFLILLILFITGLINLINFMDGMDGLVGGCMFVVFLLIFYTEGLAILPLLGSILGFLFYNWHPAKYFMGDVGSTFLGGIYAFCLLNSYSWTNLLGLILVNTPLIADSSSCILRRLLLGQNIFQPHRNHLYQRLYQSGWSHSKVSTIYIFATLLLSITYIYGNIFSLLFLASLILYFGKILDLKIASPFLK